MKIERARRELNTIDFFLQYHANDCSESSHSAIMVAVKSLEAWEKVKADITETMLHYKDWGQVEIKAQHKEEALKEVLDCINRRLTEVAECK